MVVLMVMISPAITRTTDPAASSCCIFRAQCAGISDDILTTCLNMTSNSSCDNRTLLIKTLSDITLVIIEMNNIHKRCCSASH